MYGHYYDIDYSNDPTIWYYQSHLLNTVEENKRYNEELQRQEEAYWNTPLTGTDCPAPDPIYGFRPNVQPNRPTFQPVPSRTYGQNAPLYRGYYGMPYPPYPLFRTAYQPFQR